MALEATLPRDAYISSEFYAREREAIFFREWFCACRAEEVALPGDYAVREVAGESVLVVRTKDGRIAAHYNLCRHRGSRLALGGECTGSFGGAIRCPYHAWTYELDGRLRTAPYFPEVMQRRDDFSLHGVAVEEWGGFVFVNLSQETGPKGPALHSNLREQLGAAAERVKRYPLAQLRAAKRLTYEVAANWKVLLENYNECYHCAGVHPELCAIVPAFKQQGGGALDWEGGIPHRDGATTFTLSGTTTRAPFPGLSEEEKVRHKGELIYPNLLLSLAADHVAAFLIQPRGPERTTVTCDFLFHPDEMARADFDPSDAIDFWDLVNRQDWTICESVQLGMRSRAFTRGFYAPMEDASLDIRRYIESHLGAPRA
jgi:glycine betaine catabolism A